MLDTNTLALETNMFGAGDEYFIARDKHIENVSSIVSYTFTQPGHRPVTETGRSHITKVIS